MSEWKDEKKKMFNKLYFICIKIKGISWDRVMMRSLLKRVWLKNIHVSFIYSIQYGVHGSVSATFFKHFKNVSKFVLTWRGYCGMINIDNNSKKNAVRISLLLLWNRDYDLALFFVPANKFLNLSVATQTNTRLRVLLKTNICAHSSVCKCFIQISIWQGNEVSSSIGFFLIFGLWLSNRDRFHVETLFASICCTHMPCHTIPHHTIPCHTIHSQPSFLGICESGLISFR